jgi:hypothetical protein
MECRDTQYHPRQLANALESTIDCFRCGHDYLFVGCGPHDGVCRRCGSEAVSPAGTLDVQNTTADDELEWDGTRTVTLAASDDSYRDFEFTVELGDGTPRLRAVEIAGKRIEPDSPYWGPELRFDAVERAVGKYVGDPSASLLPVEQGGGRR